MSKSYEKANAETLKLARTACEKWHTDLIKAGVEIAVLMVEPNRNEEGDATAPAIMHGGHPAAARIQVANARLRALAGVDVVIEVDAERYQELTSPQAIALFDHELTHLEVNDGRTDDDRPKLTTKPDDFAITGFESVIKRHGEDALEAMAIHKVCDNCQQYFSWMQEVAV